jgi:tetratricopeptide (TPR) repeat protein
MVPLSGKPWVLNAAVDRLIAAGSYLEALALPARFALRGPPDTASALLVQINLAEAEYNLGRWSAAWDRLRGLDPLAAMFPIARAGLAQQRAWIAAHTGRPDEALHQWQRAELIDLPRPYHAEHFFTGVVALIGTGNLNVAESCARAGEEAAIRPSSRRNALFILARVAAAMEDWLRTEALCSAAANHAYRAAGGDGLLLWGDALARLGRPAEAREAYALAMERDRQGESAKFAAERLSAIGSTAR